MRVQFDVDALDDLVQAMAFYDAESAGLGADLLAAVQEALQQIEKFPASAPLVAEGHSREARGELSLPDSVCRARRGTARRRRCA